MLDKEESTRLNSSEIDNRFCEFEVKLKVNAEVFYKNLKME